MPTAHDFGKIAVREHVLVKANKLFPPQLAIIEQRFDYLHQALETERVQEQLDAVLLDGENAERFHDINEEYAEKETRLQEQFQFIVRVNEAPVVTEEVINGLKDISHRTYLDPRGIKHSLLTPRRGDLALGTTGKPK